MILPFEDATVFIESTDSILHCVEKRGSTVICDRKLHKNSSGIKLWQADQAIFMKTTVETWKITEISLSKAPSVLLSG